MIKSNAATQVDDSQQNIVLKASTSPNTQTTDLLNENEEAKTNTIKFSFVYQHPMCDSEKDQALSSSIIRLSDSISVKGDMDSARCSLTDIVPVSLSSLSWSV